MKHLAITGNIGSGKSTACHLFEQLGIPVYYSDARAKILMIENQTVIENIKTLLGAEAYHKNGQLDRAFVASKIFNDQSVLEKMNQIVHPAVRLDYSIWRENQHAEFTLQESALTFEIGAEKIMDQVILVYAPEALLVARSIQRDGVDESSIRKRLEKQMSQDLKAKRADKILYNGLTDSLLFQVLNLYDQLSGKT